MNSMQEQLSQVLTPSIQEGPREVHITFIGGQLLPVYNAIVATEPHIVECIYSEQTKKDIETLRPEITQPIIESKPLSPTNPHKILKRAQELAERYANDNITLNITSGLKSWTHLFSLVFNPLQNARVVYMDQNNNLWDYKTMEGTNDFVFNMLAVFRLNKNTLTQYTKLTDFTEEDEESLRTIEEMRKYTRHFNSLFRATTKQEQNALIPRKGSRPGDEDSVVTWDKTGFKGGAGAKLSVTINIKGLPHEYELESPHAFQLAFNAGWFEYKGALLFSRWERAKEIILNCVFPVKSDSKKDKNEVDIIVNAGSKLIFVECKTQIERTTDIDKFRSVVKNYGGMGSKSVFVTDAVKSVAAREKCEEHGIIDIALLAEDFSEEAFFKTLNREIHQINTK